MSERRITLSIAGAGAETCIATTLDAGACPWLRVSHYGTRWECALWHAERSLPERDGRIRRWPECIAAEGRDAGEDGYRVTLTPLGECGGKGDR